MAVQALRATVPDGEARRLPYRDLQIAIPDNREEIDWVGDWRSCRSCGGLTKDRYGRCRDCTVKASKKAVEGAVDRALVRPSWVQVIGTKDKHPGADYVVIRTDLTGKHLEVLEHMVFRANWRLSEGDSLDFALGRIEGGRDKLARELGMTRDEVAYSLLFLESEGLISRAGQLKPHVREDHPWKKLSGAHTYKLPVTVITGADLAERTFRWLSHTASATVGVTLQERRREGCLKHACDTAQEGLRNAKGHWLVRRCIDIGLTEDAAEKVIGRYQETIALIGHRYTPKEALATLRSAYRHHGPLPRGERLDAAGLF